MVLGFTCLGKKTMLLLLLLLLPAWFGSAVLKTSRKCAAASDELTPSNVVCSRAVLDSK